MNTLFQKSLYCMSLWAFSALAADHLAPRMEDRELQLNLQGTAAGKAVLLETSDLHAWSPTYAFIKQNPLEKIVVPSVNEVRFFQVIYTNYTVPGDLVWIPPGRFLMGSPEVEDGRRIDEGPQRIV